MRVVEDFPTSELPARINAHLPPGVGVAVARDAPRKFHAQWQSSGKVYRSYTSVR